MFTATIAPWPPVDFDSARLPWEGVQTVTTDLARVVVGHPYATRALSSAVDSGQPSHAYALHGPAMVGKRTLATAFAQALLCSGDDRPCGECRSCQDFRRGAHPDFRLVAPDDGAQSARRGPPPRQTAIGIDVIRDLRLDSVLAPVRSPWRVYVVPDADRLTAEAMNALLKTLEEPPQHVVLVLAVERLESLLPTIVSRCQTLRLGAVPRRALAEALHERWQVDEERAFELASISRGRVGWAIQALAEPELPEAREAALERLRVLLRDGTIGRLDVAAHLAEAYGKDRDGINRLLDEWACWLRDALFVRLDSADIIAGVDREADLALAARLVPAVALREAIAAVSTAFDDLAANVNPRLVFENLVLSLPKELAGAS